MVRPTAEVLRMADMLDASGLADFRRKRRASERKRECQRQETHGGGVASISELAARFGYCATRSAYRRAVR
jgi:hypothetical protein